MSAPPASQKNAEPVWQQTGQEKRSAVKDLFDNIAPTYDRFNGLISFNRHHNWRIAAVKKLSLSSGDHVLDICCGTGDFSKAIADLHGKGVSITGFDFSANMLAIAKQKHSGSRFILADACQIPAHSGIADAATVGWGLRNVPDLDGALVEIYRVLKGGGRLAIVESVRPKGAVVKRFGMVGFKFFSTLFGSMLGDRKSYQYLPESSGRFATSDELVSRFKSAGFIETGCETRMLGHIAIVWGRKP